MHQLIEAVLSISSRFTKNDRASVHTFIQSQASLGACLAIALHIKLLDMGWEAEKCLGVGQNGTRFNSTDVCVIEADKSKHCKGVLSKVITFSHAGVHRSKTLQELIHHFEAIVE